MRQLQSESCSFLTVQTNKQTNKHTHTYSKVRTLDQSWATHIRDSYSNVIEYFWEKGNVFVILFEYFLIYSYFMNTYEKPSLINKSTESKSIQNGYFRYHKVDRTWSQSSSRSMHLFRLHFYTQGQNIVTSNYVAPCVMSLRLHRTTRMPDITLVWSKL